LAANTKKMSYYKLTVIIIVCFVISISCTKKLTESDFERKAIKIIETLDTSRIQIFKTWNYTPRGPNGIWFRKQSDSILYRCFYFDWGDSNKIIIYSFNDFLKDYSIELQPPIVDDRVIISKQNRIVKITGSNSLGYDSILLSNILEDSLFLSKNPFNDLGYVSKLKDSLGIVMVHFNSDLGGIFQFYVSTKHILTYIPNMDLIDPQYKQEWIKDFKSGKILREHWSLKKLKEPMDFN
jgi:hypothetical protein